MNSAKKHETLNRFLWFREGGVVIFSLIFSLFKLNWRSKMHLVSVLPHAQGRWRAQGVLCHTHCSFPPMLWVWAAPHAALSWLQLALEPVHQHWPAEHLLPSPADRLNFSSKPKHNTEATFSCLLSLHKYLLTHCHEEYFSLKGVICQTT